MVITLAFHVWNCILNAQNAIIMVSVFNAKLDTIEMKIKIIVKLA